MAHLVLRTVHLDADVDAELRMEAFDTGTPKNDLLGHYLRLGMETAKALRKQELKKSNRAAATRTNRKKVAAPSATG